LIRAPKIHTGNDIKEDSMVPGITDTECRIAQFRYRELRVEAERQRRATFTAPVPAGRVSVMETIHRRIGALMEQASQLLQSVRTQEAMDHDAAPGTPAVSN
jgi:hypothetical protein